MTTPRQPPRHGHRPTAAARRISRTSSRPPLGPGELRALVLNHLQTHRELDFAPAELANVLRRSRGAIINACHRLVSQGLAVRTQTYPQRYQAVPVDQPPTAAPDDPL